VGCQAITKNTTSTVVKIPHKYTYKEVKTDFKILFCKIVIFGTMV